jgi:hypothetical protein
VQVSPLLPGAITIGKMLAIGARTYLEPESRETSPSASAMQALSETPW